MNKKIEEGCIPVTISIKTGNLIKYERDNEGLREKIEPYRKTWKSVKFRLPSGKAKNETFPVDTEDEAIMELIKKKYNNFYHLFTKQSN